MPHSSGWESSACMPHLYFSFACLPSLYWFWPPPAWSDKSEEISDLWSFQTASIITRFLTHATQIVNSFSKLDRSTSIINRSALKKWGSKSAMKSNSSKISSFKERRDSKINSNLYAESTQKKVLRGYQTVWRLQK